MVKRKKLYLFGAGGAVGVAAIAAAAALALAPAHGLARADLNNDGRIETAELQQSARQRFAELDTNHDGKLVGDELPHRGGGGHGRHGHHGRHGPDGEGEGPPPPTQAATQPAQPGQTQVARPVRPNLDANGDGSVDLREFYAGFSARALRADTNHDGVISAEELAAHHGRGDRH